MSGTGKATVIVVAVFLGLAILGLGAGAVALFLWFGTSAPVVVEQAAPAPTERGAIEAARPPVALLSLIHI